MRNLTSSRRGWMGGLLAFFFAPPAVQPNPQDVSAALPHPDAGDGPRGDGVTTFTYTDEGHLTRVERVEWVSVQISRH